MANGQEGGSYPDHARNRWARSARKTPILFATRGSPDPTNDARIQRHQCEGGRGRGPISPFQRQGSERGTKPGIQNSIVGHLQPESPRTDAEIYPH